MRTLVGIEISLGLVGLRAIWRLLEEADSLTIGNSVLT
jgi:hypothetical protein